MSDPLSRILRALSLLAALALHERARAEVPVRRVEVEAAVQAALARNPSRLAAATEVARAREGVLAEEARYSYVLQADAGATRQTSVRLGAGDTAEGSTSRLYTVGSALRRTFPTGTSAEVRLQGERFESAASALGGAPSSGYGLTGRASVTQPLLRGAGVRVGEAELRVARITEEAAGRAHRRAESELVRDVILAYWELWYAEESARIQLAALELARKQERDAGEEAQRGAGAPADVFPFTTRVAELEESLVAAELGQAQRSLELGRLMGEVDPTRPLAAAASRPPAGGARATRAAVEAALRRGSPELAELEAQVTLARARAEVAGESTRPRLDVEGYLETQGVSERVPRAATRAGQLSWTTAHVGLVYELPLDDSRTSAERRSALLTLRIAEHNLRALRDRLAAEASLALTNERAAARRVTLAERTLAVAEKTRVAEKARYELGDSLPIAVLQAEEAVRRAGLRLARARVDLVQEQTIILHLTGDLTPRPRG